MLGVGTAGGLAGCSGGGGGGDDTDTPDESDGGDGGDGGDGTATPTSGENFGETQTERSTDVQELPSVGGSYDTVTSASFSTLNPLYNNEDGAGTAIGRALDMGYTFDSNQEYFPLLYDMSTDDSQVWVFEVREGLEFGGDYGEVTAETFTYQIQEVQQPEWSNTADSTSWTSDINVTQNSEYEFQVELPNARPLYPESFDPLLYPIPIDLMEPYVNEEDNEGFRQDEDLLELTFTGNLGAFTLDNWERGAGTEYSRTEDYYVQNIDEGPALFEGAPYFDGASISVVEEQSSRLAALETGEADAATIPFPQYQAYRENDSVDVYEIPQPFNEQIQLNMRDNGWNTGPGNLFRHIPFRQAMAAAIDKQGVIDGVFSGLAAPHFTWQPRFSRFYPGDDAISDYMFGMDDQYGADYAQGLAQEAFEMSEYDYSFDGDTMVNPSGNQVTLTLYHSAGQETEKLMAEYIGQELGDNLGIDVQVNAIDGTRFDSDYFSAEPQGGSATINGEEVTWEAPSARNPGPRSATSAEPWDMSVVFGLNTYPRNPSPNTAFFDGPTAFFNMVGYYPEFDASGLFEQAQSAGSTEDAIAAYEEIFVNLSREQPYIMLAFPDSLSGYNPDLVGPIENFSNGWDFPAWHFEE